MWTQRKGKDKSIRGLAMTSQYQSDTTLIGNPENEQRKLKSKSTIIQENLPGRKHLNFQIKKAEFSAQRVKLT